MSGAFFVRGDVTGFSAIVGGALALMFAAGVARAGDDEQFLVPREQLSTQESEPFRFLGYVLEDKTPPERPGLDERWDDYKDAILGHPDTISCLTADQRDAERPDLLSIDWQALDKVRAIEVCLFRIFSSLGEPDLIEDWMRLHEFRVTPFNDTNPGHEKRPGDTWFSSHGSWTPEQFFRITAFEERLPWLNIWPIWTKPFAYGINIGIGETGAVTHVEFNHYSE